MTSKNDFVIRSNELNPIRQLASTVQSAKTITIDYSPWAEDFGSVTAAVVTVESGDASVANEALTSNIKTLVVTTTNAGGSLIRIKATAGNSIHVLHIRVFTRDPQVINNDYGFVS